MVQQPSTRVTPIVVSCPADGDAVGYALREAFVGTSVPGDMTELLRDLDRLISGAVH